MEHCVEEKNDRATRTYQGVNNGDTVEAKLAPSEDADYYYLEKSEVERLNEDGKVYDIYIFFVTDDYNALKTIAKYLCPVLFNTRTQRATEIDSEFDYDIAEVEGTYCVGFALHDVASYYLDYTTVGIQIYGKLSKSCSYKMFMEMKECDGECYSAEEGSDK